MTGDNVRCGWIVKSLVIFNSNCGLFWTPILCAVIVKTFIGWLACRRGDMYQTNLSLQIIVVSSNYQVSSLMSIYFPRKIQCDILWIFLPEKAQLLVCFKRHQGSCIFVGAAAKHWVLKFARTWLCCHMWRYSWKSPFLTTIFEPGQCEWP